MAQRIDDTPEDTPASDAAPQVAQVPQQPDGPELDDRLRRWLGVEPDADAAQVADTHRQLRDYLDDAPPALRAWAAQEAAAADAAHAVLTGSAPASGSMSGSAPRYAAAAASAVDRDDFGELGDDDGLEEIRARTTGRRQPATPARAGGGRSPLAVLALLALVVGVVVGVYQLGDRGTAQAGSPQSSATAPAAEGAGGAAMPGSTPTPADPAQVAALTKKVQADPKDTAAMRDLSNLYMHAADYANAATWQPKVLEVDPKDTDAMLALGASQFNSGDLAGAEKHWRAALAIDPKKAEAHYDLGFLYLSRNPPQMEAAKAEWAKVNELAPGSDLAKTAQAHLERLERAATMTTPPAPSGTATGGGQ